MYRPYRVGALPSFVHDVTYGRNPRHVNGRSGLGRGVGGQGITMIVRIVIMIITVSSPETRCAF